MKMRNAFVERKWLYSTYLMAKNLRLKIKNTHLIAFLIVTKNMSHLKRREGIN